MILIRGVQNRISEISDADSDIETNIRISLDLNKPLKQSKNKNKNKNGSMCWSNIIIKLLLVQ